MTDPVLLKGTVEKYDLSTEGRREIVLPLRNFGSVKTYVLPGLLGNNHAFLMHLGLIAHLRYTLGAPDGWRYPSTPPSERQPDAVLYRGPLAYAVEVDVGYSREKVLRKIAHYRSRYAGQIWGLTSRARARLVSSHAWPAAVETVLIDLAAACGSGPREVRR